MNEAGGLGQGKRAFSNWRHNSIVLKFPNGNAISTIWGYGSLTKNSMQAWADGAAVPFTTFIENDEAEVMIRCSSPLYEELHERYEGDGSVIGHLSIVDWLAIVNAIACEAKEVNGDR